MSGDQDVTLKTMTLAELLFEPFALKVPDYQRVYCWEEKQVMRLLNDVYQYADKPYHMGTIILHKKTEPEHDIVDGQQRLVTLALLWSCLNGDGEIPLLKETFFSAQANKYIAYNKWLIQRFLETNKNIDRDNLKQHLTFSVLVLSSQNLDLAYTFFTNNNSRGKALSDYDLLKSHHLRFIYLPEQAEHVASRWDNLIRQSDNQNQEEVLVRTFETCLFRLRQWMRKRTWDEAEKRKIKNHFEAASIIPAIPPFGEQFHFYESIQGGTHFFGFAEHFIERYKEFQKTEPCKALYLRLNWEKHWWYRDTIASLLFAYFLKFGYPYLCDAAVLIGKYLAEHRYKNSRAYLDSIFRYVSDSEIVMMIAQATSPTFFLAELKAATDKFQKPTEMEGTRLRFKNHLDDINQQLKPFLAINPEVYGN